MTEITASADGKLKTGENSRIRAEVERGQVLIFPVQWDRFLDIVRQLVESSHPRLPPPEMGILEAVALAALVGYLQKLEDSCEPE